MTTQHDHHLSAASLGSRCASNEGKGLAISVPSAPTEERVFSGSPSDFPLLLSCGVCHCCLPKAPVASPSPGALGPEHLRKGKSSMHQLAAICHGLMGQRVASSSAGMSWFSKEPRLMLNLTQASAACNVLASREQSRWLIKGVSNP